MENGLPCGFKLRHQSGIRFLTVGVSEVVGVIAAGDFNADAMPLHKDIARRTPELDFVLVRFVGFDAWTSTATVPWTAGTGYAR